MSLKPEKQTRLSYCEIRRNGIFSGCSSESWYGSPAAIRAMDELVHVFFSDTNLSFWVTILNKQKLSYQGISLPHREIDVAFIMKHQHWICETSWISPRRGEEGERRWELNDKTISAHPTGSWARVNFLIKFPLKVSTETMALLCTYWRRWIVDEIRSFFLLERLSSARSLFLAVSPLETFFYTFHSFCFWASVYFVLLLN